jgi:hypothetical protein
MTSFCDLTIMQLSTDSIHRKSFGEFGIGLKKDWGTRNGVSPVMYVHKESQQTKRLYWLIKSLKELHRKEKDADKIEAIAQEMIDSFKYIKPYSGFWQKAKRKTKRIVYYNEREWRYSPLLNEHPILSAVIKENKTEIEKLNKILREKVVKFEVNDVKFIVVKSKKDIPVFTKAIHDMPLIDIEQKNQLITKIISFEEIREDFG